MKEATAALKLALKAIEADGWCDMEVVITAIKEALAQDELCSSQEPIFLIYDDAGGWIESNEGEYSKTEEANRWLLYTIPPKEQQSCDKRPWVSLTDEEVITMSRYDLEYAALIGEVERKLKEKNT